MFCPPPCDEYYSGEVMQTESQPAAAPQPAMPSDQSLSMPQSSAESMPTPSTANKPPQPELPATEMPEVMPGPTSTEAMPSESATDQWRPTEEPAPLPEVPSDDRYSTEPADSTAPIDNLFGGPTEPEAAPAATEPAPAATEPTPPAQSPNDLFGPAAESPAIERDEANIMQEEEHVLNPGAPIQTPAEVSEAESGDLFGMPAEAPPAESAPADDLFGPATPEVAPPMEMEPSGILGIPNAPEEPIESPLDEEAPPADTEKEQEDEEDDMFGLFGLVLREPGGLASDTMREWIDNTGRYTCHARMLQFDSGNVRLLKDNGRTTTVPVYRLSQGDLEFVHRQASAQRSDMYGHTADAGQR